MSGAAGQQVSPGHPWGPQHHEGWPSRQIEMVAALVYSIQVWSQSPLGDLSEDGDIAGDAHRSFHPFGCTRATNFVHQKHATCHLEHARECAQLVLNLGNFGVWWGSRHTGEALSLPENRVTL